VPIYYEYKKTIIEVFISDDIYKEKCIFVYPNGIEPTVGHNCRIRLHEAPEGSKQGVLGVLERFFVDSNGNGDYHYHATTSTKAYETSISGTLSNYFFNGEFLHEMNHYYPEESRGNYTINYIDGYAQAVRMWEDAAVVFENGPSIVTIGLDSYHKQQGVQWELQYPIRVK